MTATPTIPSVQRGGGVRFVVDRLQECGYPALLQLDGKYRGLCPAHEDVHPSLTVDESSETSGKAVVRCWAKCADVDILDAIGLSLRHLYPLNQQTGGRRDRRPDFGGMAERMHEALNSDAAFWNEHAVPMGWTGEAAESYRMGLDGHRFSLPEYDASLSVCGLSYLIPRALRVEGETGKKCERQSTRGLVLDPGMFDGEDRDLIAVEGPSCAMAMHSMGFVNTVAFPSAGSWNPSWAELFVGRNVKLLADCDSAGREGFEAAAKAIAKVADHVEVSDCDPDRVDGYDCADLLRDLGHEAARSAIEEAFSTRATTIRPRGVGRPPKESIEAEDFLRRVLADGLVRSDEVHRMRKAAGISLTTFKDAKNAVGVESVKAGRVWFMRIRSSEATQTTGISHTGRPSFPTS